MKRYLLFLVVLAVSVSTSLAQVSFGGGAHSGLSFSAFPKPANEFYGMGFGGGAHGDLNFLPFLSTRLSVDYTTWSSDKTKIRELLLVRDANGNVTNNYTVQGLNVTMISVTANMLGKIPTGTSVKPYGVLGFGMHFLSGSELNVVIDGQTIPVQRAPESTTNFGMNFGAGVELALGKRTNLFLESKYALVFTSGESTSYIPVTVGVSF